MGLLFVKSMLIVKEIIRMVRLHNWIFMSLVREGLL